MSEDSMVNVKALASRGDSVLVEWVEDNKYIKRGFIPLDSVENDQAHADELLSAIPYGIPWADIVKLEADPVILENELRRYNIWTLEDLTKEPNKAISVLQLVYSMDYAALKHAARQFSSKESGNG